MYTNTIQCSSVLGGPVVITVHLAAASAWLG